MKNSIRLKLFLSIIGILLVTTFIGFIINSQLYKDYYLSSQRDKLLTAARTINDHILNNDTALEDLIQNIAENNGYTIYFLPLKAPNSQMSMRGNPNPPANRPFNENHKLQVNRLLKDKNRYNYNIYYNEFYDNNFLKLLFQTDDNSILVIESPIEIINTSARFNLKFYVIISSVTILLGGIFSYFFAKKFTQPILQLNDQAKSIANLSFDDSFDDSRSDEIGTLGANMNYLSNKLQETIHELNEDLKEKEQLENLRKRFIASVSHEFKTPIALIRGYTEGLQLDINDNKEEYLSIIIDETEKMDHLVKELLEISNLESGQTKLSKQTFDLSSLLDEVLYKYSRLFTTNGISVEIDKDDIVTITADYKKIEEVFTNYLNNALKHIDSNSLININLTTRDTFVRCEVFNSGQPIPADSLDHIWNSFYKVDSSRNREGHSTGLGLYIVKKIIELHNGNYGVINHNDGVEFYFELPI